MVLRFNEPDRAYFRWLYCATYPLAYPQFLDTAVVHTVMAPYCAGARYNVGELAWNRGTDGIMQCGRAVCGVVPVPDIVLA